MLSPSEVVLVCQVGDQVEVTCTTLGMFLQWELFKNTSLTRLVSSAGVTATLQPFMVNSTAGIFSRDTAPGVLPLKSTVMINPVTVGLNGSVVTCVDVETSNTSSTTIYIAGGMLSMVIMTATSLAKGCGSRHYCMHATDSRQA